MHTRGFETVFYDERGKEQQVGAQMIHTFYHSNHIYAPMVVNLLEPCQKHDKVALMS